MVQSSLWREWRALYRGAGSVIHQTYRWFRNISWRNHATSQPNVIGSGKGKVHEDKISGAAAASRRFTNAVEPCTGTCFRNYAGKSHGYILCEGLGLHL